MRDRLRGDPWRIFIVGAVLVAFALQTKTTADIKKEPQAVPETSRRTSLDAPFPAMEALQREMMQLAKSVEPSVVEVIAFWKIEKVFEQFGEEIQFGESHERMTRRVGTGVVLDLVGNIATIGSVVSGASEIIVVTNDGKKRPAHLRGIDEYSGLAVLNLDQPSTLKPINMDPVGDVKVGTLVVTFAKTRLDQPEYSMGFVSGTGVHEGPSRIGRFLRLNAYTAPGGPSWMPKGDSLASSLQLEHGITTWFVGKAEMRNQTPNRPMSSRSCAR